MSMASSVNHEFVIHVRTGDVQGAGTDANVSVILHDEQGSSTDKFSLDYFFRNDFEKGNLDVFQLPKDKAAFLNKLSKLEIFRDDSGFGSSWYVERITVENKSNGDVYIFPVFRWLRPHYHYVFRENDTFLPQDDAQQEQRRLDLEDKRRIYVVDTSDVTLPASIKELPADELFSRQYRWDIQKLKMNLIVQSRITMFTTGRWNSLDDISNVYVREIFNQPWTSHSWRDDSFFGYQRLNGVCPALIQLCSHIPQKLAVTQADLEPVLEGKSVEEALSDKRLFVCDLKILHNFKCKSENYVVCAPIVLLYRDNQDRLLPVAIQLFQEPGPNNPVFLPSDDPKTWLLVKMWYNQAEATYHQSLTHLGYTHLLMEGVTLALHRHVSISHPIFKLLAPHLLYIFPINKFAVERLLSVDGWIDSTMAAGRNGVLELNRKGRKDWRMDIQGTLPEDLRRRGVSEENVLPGYYYRDDSLLLYNAIKTYVTSYVDLYYDTPQRLADDTEMQAWAREMVQRRENGGMDIQGIPGNGKFRDLDDLILTLTSFIFTCSVQHAAVNFPQYDYYGFPPLYALTLEGQPPSDKTPRTEADILNVLPDKERTFDAMIVTKILSQKGVNSLGDFEVQYVFDPKATEIVEKFRKDLASIGTSISTRNRSLDMPYEYLHPDSIPNSISI
ncbi:polyunsaturated fatty acid 5-lipoxygenase-like [Haliotis rufescens]|uniref:polyunsaturated fatty acid 5-lipoxygenase-like n=1 Tax=Haliotis rufescens TaxID=6454 RepID=UPI001EAFBF09|nr:polyunsaturated fatty acid 5-lipoxygenase-like [Haliotis rufescens]